jgi:hypothetical protein
MTFVSFEGDELVMTVIAKWCKNKLGKSEHLIAETFAGPKAHPNLHYRVYSCLATW